MSTASPQPSGPGGWTVPPAPEIDGALTDPERPTLVGYLGFHRRTLWNICAGLTGEQLALRPLPSTSLSLLGLVRHLAKVERIWLRIRVPAVDLEPLYDPAAGKDHDFEATDAAAAPRDFATWQAECRAGDEAVAGLSLEHTFLNHGTPMSLRMTYLHLIGEYARHNGHADLLREAIDGRRGR